MLRKSRSLQRAIDFCTSTVKDKYDFRALIYFLLYNLTPPQIDFIWEDDFIGKCFNVNNAYFCSELVSNGLLDAGVYCFERDPYKVMPIDFNNPLLFDTVTKVELPSKENKAVYFLKSILFKTVYLVSALLFPLIIFIIAALIIVIIGFAVLGLWGIIVFLLGLISTATLTLKKKPDETKKKP